MVIDTKAARDFAEAGYTYTGEEVRVWVHGLADEVDRLRAKLAARAAYECHDGIACRNENRAECDISCARLRG